MSLTNQFISFVAEQDLFRKKDRLLLAVSGGLDSVVLCELCREAGFAFRIAHCNFRLRGNESDRDESFVRSLGDRYQVPVFVKRFDTEGYAKEKNLSVQVAARELRYDWFHSLMQDESVTDFGNETHGVSETPVYLLTGHHQDDNVETLLMNFFKGTGIAGLRGMLPRQGKIIRPLLFAGRMELAAFANERQLTWVEDSSNLADKYSRNYFRHQVIPLVERVYPQAIHNLADNIPRFREVEMLYQEALTLHKKKLMEYRGQEIHIPVLKLRKTGVAKTLVYEISRGYGFSAHQSDEILKLLDSESGKYVQSATHRILRHRAWLIIAPLETGGSDHVLVESTKEPILFPGGKLVLEVLTQTPDHIQDSTGHALLDARKISFPIILRKWKTGDYFYPLGMSKKKKISRFLMDLKLSRTEKEKQWVLEMDKKIIWVVGRRIDDRFKLNDNTTEVLAVSLKPA